MKTKVKIYIIAASLGLLSTQAFATSSGINQRDHFRFDRTNPAGQDVIVENNYYYGDGDYIYDYYYASRIRRFHSPYVSYSYYNSYYTDCYWYTYEPSFWGMSIYLGSMWNPVGLTISFGYPYRNYYSSYYYDPYPWYPVYNIVYRPRIVNRYYYNTWYGNRIRYHKPFYANRYYYHNNYRDFHRDGYYSRPYKYAYNYGASNNYRKNQVVPSRTSINRDNNRNSNVINSSRRSLPTNTTSRTGNNNSNVEKGRRVVSNTDVGRRNSASDRTIIENRNNNKNVSPVTRTNRSDENRRIVTNTRRNTPVPNNDRNINRSQNKIETRKNTDVRSRNESSRSDYRAPRKNSSRTRISKPANTNRSNSYRVPAKTKKSNVRSSNSRSNNSSKKVTRSSGNSKSKGTKSGSGSKSSRKKSSGRRR